MAGRSPVVAFVLMLASGLILGLWSAVRVLGSAAVPGATSHGPWIAWHKAGSPDADPYSLAAFASAATCRWRRARGLRSSRRGFGRRPPAHRLPLRCAWRLSALARMDADRIPADGSLAPSPSSRTGFTSAEALVEDGAIAVALSPEPAPATGCRSPATSR